MMNLWRRHSSLNLKCVIVFGAVVYVIVLVYEALISKAPQNPILYLPDYIEEATDEYFEERSVTDIVPLIDIQLMKKDPNSTHAGTTTLPPIQKIPEYAYFKDMKYLLLWIPELTPLTHIKEGQDSFIENGCEYFNCFVSGNRTYLKKLNQFDVIIFPSDKLLLYPNVSRDKLPKRRSPKQKYIFASLESAAYYPANVAAYDDFFNWTWTYRLSSDIHWRYLKIYDIHGNLIGPAENMKWRVEYEPVSEEIKTRLSHKSKAAAWFVSHCTTISRREMYVADLKAELTKYDLMVDTFGICGNKHCPKFSDACSKMLQKEYYFYLSFENSFDEDYVTEKLLHGLLNFAVPIVYGGADYSRFLPPGSYLDARLLGPKNLAKKMNDIINNASLYHDYFRWRNYYVYKSSVQSELCNLCKTINNNKMAKKVTRHLNFRQWWIGATKKKVIDFLTTIFTMDKSLQKLALSSNNTREFNRLLYVALKNQTNVSSLLKFLNNCVIRDLNETYNTTTNTLPSTTDINTKEILNGTTTAEYDDD